ncbi:hypothetical protein [Methylosinus sporium]|uniref:hypothetical protein n=1 Tax=Methylosinus sporium TaxID=428 RepID=UPI00383A77DD
MSFPWNEHVIGGQTYSLAHLKPFTMPVTPKAEGAPTYKLYVSFGIHTVSKEWDAAHPADHKIEFGAEARCFCPIRHGHSLYLPTIVRQASAGKAYFSQRQNFLLIENLPGLDGPYAVFFNIERSKSTSFDAAMFVVSAYEKPNLPKNLPRITFATLVSKTARGEAVTRPKK